MGFRSASGPLLAHFGTILRSSDPFGVPFWVQERLWAALGIILEPFKVHGSVLGSMSGSILGSRSASGQPTPCQDRLWSHFGAILGPNLGPKSSLKTRPKLIPFLTPFWDQFWSYFGSKFGPNWMAFGICVDSPGVASPRDGCSLFFEHLGHAKSLKNQWFLIVFDISAEAVLATQIHRNNTNMYPLLCRQWIQNTSQHGVRNEIKIALEFRLVLKTKLSPKRNPK